MNASSSTNHSGADAVVSGTVNTNFVSKEISSHSVFGSHQQQPQQNSPNGYYLNTIGHSPTAPAMHHHHHHQQQNSTPPSAGGLDLSTHNTHSNLPQYQVFASHSSPGSSASTSSTPPTTQQPSPPDGGAIIDMSLYRTSAPEKPFTGYHYCPPRVYPEDPSLQPPPAKRPYTDPSASYGPGVGGPTSGGGTSPHTHDQTQPGSSQQNGQQALLPPCRVCGEKASGFHYGANTCEACKGFFRRSLQKDTVYKCSAQGNCKILPGKRHVCAHCRYKKCLDIGMSKTAIKTGRYTHEKKNRDQEEVKRLELQAKMRKEGKVLLTPEEREKELDKIIRHITTVHLQQTPHTPDFFEKLPEREAQFLERRALQEQMFGTMKPLPREEYRQIYQTTGIDIDGRREMITHMIPSIEKAIKKFIAFAKALPGFKDLPIDDQIALIKASRLECMVIFHAPAIDVETKIGEISFLEGVMIHLFDECGRYVSEEYLNGILKIIDKIQKIELLPEETVIFVGLVLLSGEAELSSEAQQSLESMKDLLTEILSLLLKKNHGVEEYVFLKLISVMWELKYIKRIGEEQEDAVLSEYSDVPFTGVIEEITDRRNKLKRKREMPYL